MARGKTVTEVQIEIRHIMRMLPHRYPFLLVDRITGYDADAGRLEAYKNVTINEPFFTGHFPDLPVMPGVLILEAMAQAAGLLAIKISGHTAEEGSVLYFAGIDKARFKRPVVPGDRLVFKVELLKNKRDIWKFSTRAEVDGELASAAEMMCALRKTEVI